MRHARAQVVPVFEPVHLREEAHFGELGDGGGRERGEEVVAGGVAGAVVGAAV